MTNPLDPEGERMHTMADADQARLWAIEALQKGRLALGLALARIAVYASRAAARIPQPTMPAPVMPVSPADIAFLPAASESAWADEKKAWLDKEADPPVGNGDADLSAEAEATIAAQLDQRYAKPETSAPVLESARCLASITGRSGGGPVGEQCWGVLYLEPTSGVWRHMVAPADGDHVPEPAVELPERRS